MDHERTSVTQILLEHRHHYMPVKGLFSGQPVLSLVDRDTEERIEELRVDSTIVIVVAWMSLEWC